MTQKLSGIVAEHIRAVSAFDTEAIVATIAEDGQNLRTPNTKEIALTTDITNNLPQVVADHIAACNAHDAEAWMATFAPDAMLNDIQREFIGTAAIRSFGEREIFGVKVTMEVQRAWDRHGDVTVHAKFDGTYDKAGLPDPLILSLYFSLRGDQITQLIIIHNKTEV